MAIITVNKNGVEKSQLVWIKKSKTSGRSYGHDIMLSVNRGSGKQAGERDRATIHFYNKVGEQIAPSQYILFAIDGDRLYMTEGNKIDGFKIGNSKGSSFAQATDPVFVEWTRKRRGNYSLYQDSKSGLYYIEGKELEA